MTARAWTSSIIAGLVIWWVILTGISWLWTAF